MLAPTVSGLNINPYGRKLRKEAALAAEALAQSMHDSGGGNLIIQSAYRSFTEQTAVHSRQVKRYGLKVGEALAARPGYSEHQTGLAMDVSARGQGCQIRVCFGQTKAGRWLATNAYKYGFIVRYPNHSTPITGYQYEPWHLRYVGVDIATDMNTKKIHILETYFHLPSAPNY
jgi:D-alanyl-D-alanine carboxypeptidase